ncbi:MAG TPA: hypothetical protein VFX70_22185 [Mycobacteriales bacterium]|nr:hypothetical protein [Mycobacteriales bacterium]
MRLRPAIITGALLTLGIATPAHAATPDTMSPVTAGSASAVGPLVTAARPGPPANPLADPGPECTGQGGNCWEYYSWYWTYSSCHNDGRAQLQNNPGRYDNYNCAGGHGLVVWLWLHRP